MISYMMLCHRLLSKLLWYHTYFMISYYWYTTHSPLVTFKTGSLDQRLPWAWTGHTPKEWPQVDGRGGECHPFKQPGPQPRRQRTASDILLHSVGVWALQMKTQGTMLSIEPGRPPLSRKELSGTGVSFDMISYMIWHIISYVILHMISDQCTSARSSPSLLLQTVSCSRLVWPCSMTRPATRAYPASTFALWRTCWQDGVHSRGWEDQAWAYQREQDQGRRD